MVLLFSFSVVPWLVPCENTAVSAQVLRTPYNPEPLYSVTIQSCISKTCVCFAVTCYAHFWQNDQDLLCAISLARGWNVHWSKSQHRKLTMEKKILLPLLKTFQSQICCSTTELSPLPNIPAEHCVSLIFRHFALPHIKYSIYTGKIKEFVFYKYLMLLWPSKITGSQKWIKLKDLKGYPYTNICHIYSLKNKNTHTSKFWSHLKGLTLIIVSILLLYSAQIHFFHASQKLFL